MNTICTLVVQNRKEITTYKENRHLFKIKKSQNKFKIGREQQNKAHNVPITISKLSTPIYIEHKRD